MAVDLVIWWRDASLGWGSLLMSFSTAGYVIFLPQRWVIDSAAGTGWGLPAWHRSLPGVLGSSGGTSACPGSSGGTAACLGSHVSSGGTAACLGSRGSLGSRPLKMPLSIPQPGRRPLP